MATPRSSHHLVAAAAIAAAGVSYPPPLPPTPHGASAASAPHDAGSAGGAARQIVDSLLARFLPLARRRIETAQAQDGQYLRPSDPSYEQVLDSESPKGAHDASAYQKKEKNHRSMALDCLHRLVKFYVNVYADYQPRNHVWDYLDSVTSQLLTVLKKGLLTQDVQHDKLVLCDLSREEPGFDSLL